MEDDIWRKEVLLFTSIPTADDYMYQINSTTRQEDRCFKICFFGCSEMEGFLAVSKSYWELNYCKKFILLIDSLYFWLSFIRRLGRFYKSNLKAATILFYLSIVACSY